MIKESRLLRIGVVGAGPIAQFAHLDACRRGRNTELYAICDVADDLLARVAALYHPRVTYPSLNQLLADPLVEAVIVATSDAFHVPLALQAVRAGKPVFVEKPLGLVIADCEELARESASAGVDVQVGFNRRFDPALAFAHCFVQERMGPPATLHAWYCDSVFRYTMTDNLQAIPVTSELKRKPAQDPKQDKRRYFLLTHGSHLLDTAYFLAGPIGSVRARHREVDGSYVWSIAVEFASGCFGSLTLMVPAASDFEEGFQLFGPGGSVQGKLNLPWFRKAGSVECFSAGDAVYRRPLGADADSYRLQLESFADAVLHQQPQTGATVQEGVANLRALVAIARSAETGKAVYLDQVEGAV